MRNFSYNGINIVMDELHYDILKRTFNEYLEKIKNNTERMSVKTVQIPTYSHGKHYLYTFVFSNDGNECTIGFSINYKRYSNITYNFENFRKKFFA